MKVILLAPTPPPVGGIAEWTFRMMKATLKNEWTIELVDEKIIGKREAFGNNQKRSIRCEIIRCLRIWKKLMTFLDNIDAKVVHSCIPATTQAMMREYICALITKIRRRKFVIHFRCTVPNMINSRIGLLMFTRLCNVSDMVIALNRQTEEFVKKHTASNVKIIPNFVEHDTISLPDTKNISKEIKRVLYVGGIIETKGCMDIVTVAKSFPLIEFRLVGKVSNEMRMKIVELHVENVILTGVKSREEVKVEMLEADIFIFLSYFPGEGFSNALAEAMAAGLPCIVSDWAANKDMISEGGGFVVPIKDAVKASVVLENMKSQEIRRKQSNYNIRKVQNEYSDSNVLDMYVDAYESLWMKCD